MEVDRNGGDVKSTFIPERPNICRLWDTMLISMTTLKEEKSKIRVQTCITGLLEPAYIIIQYIYKHIIGVVIYCYRPVSLTCPLSSSRLLVSLSASKETVCFIHWAPLAGESGWKCILPGVATSARPATSHDELWKAYL